MKNNKKGFTLAELLIVVAIIAVLVAISIPIFTAQLKKARLATNQANARAAYAATVAGLLDQNKTTGTGTYSVATAKLNPSSIPTTVATDGDSTPITKWKVSTVNNGKTLGEVTVEAWEVAIDSTGKVTYKAS